jgi:hypothetical protein
VNGWTLFGMGASSLMCSVILAVTGGSLAPTFAVIGAVQLVVAALIGMAVVDDRASR